VDEGNSEEKPLRARGGEEGDSAAGEAATRKASKATRKEAFKLKEQKRIEYEEFLVQKAAKEVSRRV